MTLDTFDLCVTANGDVCVYSLHTDLNVTLDNQPSHCLHGIMGNTPYEHSNIKLASSLNRSDFVLYVLQLGLVSSTKDANLSILALLAWILTVSIHIEC